MGRPGPRWWRALCRHRWQPVRVRRARLTRLAGMGLDAPEIEAILAGLGFSVVGGPEEWQVQPPTWRHDISTEACIVEELARLPGYDRIPLVAVYPQLGRGCGPLLTPVQRRRSAVRRTVADLGYAEAVTWSFIPPEQASVFGASRAGAQAQPAQRRAVGAAAIAPGQPGRSRGQEPRPQAGKWRAVRGRAAVYRRLPGEQVVALAGVRFGAAEAAPLGGPPAAGRCASTPRPTRWRPWPPWASSQKACRSRPMRRPGTTPAARAACGRAERGSPPSASCIRASCGSSTSPRR